VKQALSQYFALNTKGQMVMSILNRCGSGYGREQLLLVALRLACQELEGWLSPKQTEGDLVLVYLMAAEAAFKDDPDA
jgi:hypothetical protein